MRRNNDSIQGLILFSSINRLGSLTAAAQLLGISRSSVSKQLSALEQRIGSRLFNRSTRKISLTAVGRQVLDEAHKIEQAVHAIEYISEDAQTHIRGELKISCASAQGRAHLLPLLSTFLSQHPQLNVNLQLDDQFVDMVANNIDISIRIGHLPDSALIARKLGELSTVLCASPSYLKDAPPLTKPSDLLQHRCLFYRNANISMNRWTFAKDNAEQTVEVSGPLSVNDPGALVTAAIANTGVLLTDQALLGDTLQQGSLIQVLENFRPISSLPIYIVYPQKKHIPAKTRALVDFLIQQMPARLEAST